MSGAKCGVLKYTMVVQHPDTFLAVPLYAGKPVPKWAKDLVHADDLTDGDDGSGDGGSSTGDPGGETPSPYKGWVKAQFEAEIVKRNDGRPDEALIKPEGTKNADLEAALVADDALVAAAAAAAGDGSGQQD